MNPSHRRTVRMLAMVPYLQSAQGIPVDDLAQQFGVSRKQVLSDLNLLMFTGVGEYPGELIDFELDDLEQHGIVRIRDAEFMPRPLRISVAEASSLIVALRTVSQISGGEIAQAVDSLLVKLEAAVGQVVDPPIEIALPQLDPGIRDAIAKADSRGLCLQIDYAGASRDEVTVRDVEPAGVFVQNGAAYLAAWCHLAEAARTFRIDRILAARVLDRPVRSQAERGPIEPVAEFTPGDSAVSAIVELDEQAMWMIDEFDAEILSEDPAPVRARIEGSDASWLSRLVLGSGGAMRVLEPEELRERVLNSVRRALAEYAE